MRELELLLELLKANRMAKKHEDWGYPRGWNAAFEFIEQQIEKLKAK